MRRFWLTRLPRLLLTTWGIISLIFLLSRSLSTDQLVIQLIGEAEMEQPTVSAAHRARAEQQVRQRLGLDRPLFYFSFQAAAASPWGHWHWHGRHNQYHIWLRALLRGDLGHSYRDGQPVTGLLYESLGNTLPLTLSALAIASCLALWLAVWMTEHTRWQQVVLVHLLFIDALPLFVLALILLLLFANPNVLAWFPAYGFGYVSPDDDWWVRVGSYFYHLVLPLISLVLVTLPGLVTQLSAALNQEMARNYVLTAWAKGLATRQVVRRHALRNALLPALTLFMDTLPVLVGGAVVVESIFALPGMGGLLAHAAAGHDYPVLLGGVLLTALVRLFSQLLGDWLYAQADPRIQVSA